MRAVLALLIALLLTACAASPQPVVEDTPTPTVTVIASATPTDTPTATPVTTPTPPTNPPEIRCEPTATPVVGSVIVRAWVDSSEDGEWQTDREPGVDADVLLLYQGFPADGLELPTGTRGLAVADLLPGGYWITVRDYRGEGIYPAWDNAGTAVVSAGQTTIVKVRFWRP